MCRCDIWTNVLTSAIKLEIVESMLVEGSTWEGRFSIEDFNGDFLSSYNINAHLDSGLFQKYFEYLP